MILVVVPCILQCAQQMIDKTIRVVFIIQEINTRNKMTQNSQDLTEIIDESININENFKLRPEKKQDLLEQ